MKNGVFMENGGSVWSLREVQANPKPLSVFGTVLDFASDLRCRYKNFGAASGLARSVLVLVAHLTFLIFGVQSTV
jgi:hypothetical protein